MTVGATILLTTPGESFTLGEGEGGACHKDQSWQSETAWDRTRLEGVLNTSVKTHCY